MALLAKIQRLDKEKRTHLEKIVEKIDSGELNMNSLLSIDYLFTNQKESIVKKEKNVKINKIFLKKQLYI